MTLLGSAIPVLVLLFVLLLLLTRPTSSGQQLRLDQWLDLMEGGRITNATIHVQDARITGSYGGRAYWVAFPNRESGFQTVLNAVRGGGTPTAVDQQWGKSLIGPIMILLPALVFVDAFLFIFLLMRQGATVGALGRARAKTVERRATFADVAGAEEAVEELRDVKDYLESPDRFVRMGAHVPRGVLLAGPPGCGKTLLARALSGEARVPFFSISGSDFVEVYVGVGASRIRDLFRRAKQDAPAIVFIDELDAVGRGRQVTTVGGQDEREATLNQLLVEMDGFDESLGVVVLAATNRPDILDPALLRPGRFDRRIVLDRPDLRGRRSILDVHAEGKPLGDDVDLDGISRRTPGFSGADLANVVNEGAILATRRGDDQIHMPHLLEAVERVLAGGPERRNRVIGERERRVIAVHEAGHAIAAAAQPDADRPSKVSIVARGQSLGFTFVEPVEDRYLATRPQLMAQLAALEAGRVAELLEFGEPSTGAQDDLTKATRTAGWMVRSLGMSDRLGSLVLSPPDDDGGSLLPLRHSEALVAEADGEVRRLLEEAEGLARMILTTNHAALLELADALVKSETVEGEELRSILDRVIHPGRADVTLEGASGTLRTGPPVDAESI